MRYCFLAGLFLLGAVWVSEAQEQTKGNATDIDKVLVAKQKDFYAIVSGERKPTSDDDALFKAQAEKLIFPFTWPTVHRDANALADQLKYVQDRIKLIENGKGKAEVAPKLGFHLGKSIDDVFSLGFDGNKFSLINAAASLPYLSKVKGDDVGEAMMRLASSEKQHLIVRMYASEALGDSFPIKALRDELEDPKNPKVVTRKERDIRRVNALVNFIEQDWSKTPVDEGAARFMRRKAIEALARAEVPGVYVSKKTGAAEGLVAPTLIKVLTKDALKPDPSLQEKISAAIGLCNMKGEWIDSAGYNPDVATYLVGRTLSEFLSEYSTDYVNFGVAVKENRKPPLLYWKTESKRLEAALKDYAVQLKGTSSLKAAKDLEIAMVPVLQKTVFAFARLDDSTIPNIRNRVQQIKPSNTKLFEKANLPPITLE